jgi:hypothetical protein
MTINEVFELIDASRPSTETVAPFLTIVGVDSTFLAVQGSDSADRVVFQLLSCTRPDNIQTSITRYSVL